jgi:signal recognition particle receptor subunit beta
MSFVNYQTKEVNCKIVYYGPGLSGKTTNIQYIHQKSALENSELIALNTENERTLFFDFLPLSLGEVRGFKTRFHLYTVPGQVIYEASRKLILRGVDGIVFVADSQVERIEDNLESYSDLKINLEEQGYDIENVPLVFQWNKRDLPNVVSVMQLNQQLNELNKPYVEASAISGDGVFETLNLIGQMVLLNIKGGLK